MPAYRSPAEAEIREAVVAFLRKRRPNARIIHEINTSLGGNRIDVLAVDRAELIAVEIKSAKDKLDRLRAQAAAMRECAHHVIAAIHEKFLVEQITHEKASHYQRDGVFYLLTLPEWHPGVTPWVYPQVRRVVDPDWQYDSLEHWRMPAQQLEVPAPAGAINMLWRNELFDLCGVLRVSVPRRATMADMARALRWHCTGKELTRGICWSLRARECVEADPAIVEGWTL